MIKQLMIERYRKLSKIDISFSPNLNAISGTNGTCKTSILHLISNSFQAVTTTCEWVKDVNCIKVIKTLNSVVNPKVESLTRGDKNYNDPAHDVKGILFNVEYYGASSLGFRRHNSDINSRYAIKPQYQKDAGDSLPFCPIVYLGLPRLVPYGEFKNETAISDVKNCLPENYQKELCELYKKFTRYSITPSKLQQMGDVKTRTDFISDKEGIDSNTISAGEDNLYIILSAIISLKYYYESIESKNEIESILLIDEFDATLHPAYQIKLLKLLRDFSKNYKIQIVFTTHSMSTLEAMLKERDNVVYLVDNITNVVKMDSPDIYKIQMHLNAITHEELYLDKVVPIFTEDEEARTLINMLLDYYEEKRPEFVGVRRYLHFVGVNIGADSLTGIFKDIKLLRSTMKAICILDGDHGSDLSNNIVSLPGKNKDNAESGFSPEKLLFDYAQILFDSDSDFWSDQFIIEKGYGKIFYCDSIKAKIDEFEESVKQKTNTKKPREFNKELFNRNRVFFQLLFKKWLNDENNRKEKYRFYTELRQAFRNNAICNGINPDEWKVVQ